MAKSNVSLRQNTYNFTFRDKYGSCRITVVSHNLQCATIDACRKYSKYDASTNVSCEVELNTGEVGKGIKQSAPPTFLGIKLS